MDLIQDIQELKEAVLRIEKRLDIGEKKVLSVSDVAGLLQLSTDRVYRLVSEKMIPYYKTATRRIWFDRAEVEEWMKAERIAPDSELIKQAAAYTAKNH